MKFQGHFLFLLPSLAFLPMLGACIGGGGGVGGGLSTGLVGSTGGSGGGSGGGTSLAVSKKIARGSKTLKTSSGYVSLGCASPSTYNFCFSLMDSNGTVTAEYGDLPKITLGAGGYTTANSIAITSAGDFIIVGSTTGTLGETQGGNGDGFVARFSASGTRIWLKQFGNPTMGYNSNQREDFFDVAVDSSDNIYIVGRTRSNFGATNAGNFDAILLKLNSSGVLGFTKQLSTANDESLNHVVISQQGHIVAAGQTCGNLFETNGGSTSEAGYSASAACPTANFNDVIVVSYTTAGTLRFDTQLGRTSLASGKGAKSELVSDLSVSSTGEIFLTGGTESSFAKSSDATQNAEGPGGNLDVYVARLNSTGVLQWIDVLGALVAGSTKVDIGEKILLREETNELLVCAHTLGNLLETHGGGSVGSASTSFGKGDVVLLKYSTTGTLSTGVQYGNVTAGISRSLYKETCGSMIRESSYITLFGTTASTFYSTGSGNAFISRDSIDGFESSL